MSSNNFNLSIFEMSKQDREDYLKRIVTEQAEDLKKVANLGHAEAQYRLGCCYYNGEGPEQNYNKAMKCFMDAAELGHGDAQHKLGDCYYEGKGVEENPEKAIEWYEKAAEQGNVHAQYKLADSY
mgnify:FL=1